MGGPPGSGTATVCAPPTTRPLTLRARRSPRHIRARRSAVLALAAEHKYPKGLDRKVLEEPPEGCKETVSKHDMVHIVHKGYALNADGSDGELMDANPPKPGTKDVPEPLVISIGKGQVLRGMEQGLIGTCLDQTIELIMAPELVPPTPPASCYCVTPLACLPTPPWSIFLSLYTHTHTHTHTHTRLPRSIFLSLSLSLSHTHTHTRTHTHTHLSCFATVFNRAWARECSHMRLRLAPHVNLVPDHEQAVSM